MDFIILGIGAGCCTYSFINYRCNSDPWMSSLFFLLGGLVIVVIGILLHFFI